MSALRLIETEPEPRLVNCYQIHGLHLTATRIEHDKLAAADGDPERALTDAIKASADGLLVVDARTGEQWYLDVAAVAACDFAQQLAFVRLMDEYHRNEGHVLCWCSRWVHPNDLYEGTCGAAECLRNEAKDHAGLVP